MFVQLLVEFIESSPPPVIAQSLLLLALSRAGGLLKLKPVTQIKTLLVGQYFYFLQPISNTLLRKRLRSVAKVHFSAMHKKDTIEDTISCGG